MDKSVNSSSSERGNFLFENYKFSFEGQITITETCPQNGSLISKHWKFNSTATIVLPLICSLNSTKINCGSVSLQSSQTERITLEHHHMQVIEKQTFEHSKITVNKTSFVRNSAPVKIASKSSWTFTNLKSLVWVIIGLGIFVVSLTACFTTYKLCTRNGQSDSRVSISREFGKLN